MVTLTNKTNRHIEIESKDGVALIINSRETSKPLDEEKFTERTMRLIHDGKFIKKVIPVEKPKETLEVPTEDTKNHNKKAGKSK